MSHTPCAAFYDMHDRSLRLTVEQNTATGVWLCATNKGTNALVALDLSDEEAARLADFLSGLKRGRK